MQNQINLFGERDINQAQLFSKEILDLTDEVSTHELIQTAIPQVHQSIIKRKYFEITKAPETSTLAGNQFNSIEKEPKIRRIVLGIDLFLPEERAELSEYQCKICDGVYFRPAITPCSHIFCEDCIKEHLKTYNFCPACLGETQLSSIYQIPFISQILNKKTLSCPYVPCDWKNKLIDYDKHLEECIFIEVKCKNLGCNVQLQRKEMQIHLTKCEFKVVNCPNCNIPILFKKQEKHLASNCQKTFIKCPYSCGKMLLRSDTMMHSLTCDNAEVNCELSQYGCDFKCKRSLMKSHYDESKVIHFNIMLEHSQLIDSDLKANFDEIDCLLQTHESYNASKKLGIRRRGRPAKIAEKHEEKKQSDAEIENEVIDSNSSSYSRSVQDAPILREARLILKEARFSPIKGVNRLGIKSKYRPDLNNHYSSMDNEERVGRIVLDQSKAPNAINSLLGNSTFSTLSTPSKEKV